MADWFDPWITPPPFECSVCRADAKAAINLLGLLKREDKPLEAIMNHTHTCRWYDHFAERVHMAYPDALLLWKSNKAAHDLMRAHERLMRAVNLKCWWIKGQLVTEMYGHRIVGATTSAAAHAAQ